MTLFNKTCFKTTPKTQPSDPLSNRQYDERGSLKQLLANPLPNTHPFHPRSQQIEVVTRHDMTKHAKENMQLTELTWSSLRQEASPFNHSQQHGVRDVQKREGRLKEFWHHTLQTRNLLTGNPSNQK